MKAGKLRVRTEQNGDVASRRYQQNGDFRKLLAQSGLAQADLARRIRAHPNTVSRWSKGERLAPGAVLAYLELYVQAKAMIE